MGDKSFRVRIKEEATNFATIYADFVEAHKRYVDSTGNQEGTLNAWYHAFEVPFESSVKAHLAKHPEEKKDFKLSRHDAVVGTIQALELDELHLGGLTHTDPRISMAIEFGLLKTDDLAVLSEEDKRSLGIGKLILGKPDRGDPFFWRTLLEIFCRAYIASRGRPPWTLALKIELAFDLDEIRKTKPDQKWKTEDFLKALRKEPYKSKYPSSVSVAGRGGVGEDRVREIVNWMHPMDDDALERLKEKYETAFFEVADKREAGRPPNLNGIREKLQLADKLSAAFSNLGRDRDG
jgi:hypothetical protein